MTEYKCEKCRKPLEKSYYACDYCIQAARIAGLEAACKLENELKTAGSLRELKLMGEVDELRKQLADLRVDRDTLAACVGSVVNWAKQRDFVDGGNDTQMQVNKLARLADEMNDAVSNASGALTRAGKDHT